MKEGSFQGLIIIIHNDSGANEEELTLDVIDGPLKLQKHLLWGMHQCLENRWHPRMCQCLCRGMRSSCGIIQEIHVF